MQRTIELSVDDKRYQTTMYSASYGLRLGHRLVKVAGRPFGTLMSSDMKANVSGEFIAGLIESMTEILDENTFISLIHDILSTTMVMDTQGFRPVSDKTFEVDFAGEYLHLFKLVKEVLSFQFGSFFGGVAGLFNDRQTTQDVPPTQRIKARK